MKTPIRSKQNCIPPTRPARRLPAWPAGAALLAGLAAGLWSSPSAQASPLLWQGSGSNTNWDLGLSSDWLQGGNPTTYTDGADVVFDDSAACLTPNLTVLVQPHWVTLNATNNYVLGGSGSIGGTTGLTKDGTGTLLLGTANTFSGPVTVQKGVLQLGNSGALGSMAGTYVYVTNGGTLDLNTYVCQSRTYVIAGAGYNGQGALTDSANTTQHYEVSNIVLSANATIGGYGRWDMAASGGSFEANGFDLTKVGPGEVWLSPGDKTNGVLSNLGNLDIQQGAIGLRTIAAVGDPNKTITVETNCFLALWGNPGLLNKKLVLNSAFLTSGLTSPESSNNWMGTITLTGTNTIVPGSATLRLWNTLSGPGGFIMSGSTNLCLDAANTYTGPTFLNSGTIVLGPSASINSSSLIQVSAGRTLDASAATSGVSRSAGQTLIAGAGATILGNVTIGASATFTVGVNGPGLVTVNSLALAGSTNVFTLGNIGGDTSGTISSIVQANGDLNLSGLNTFVFTPSGILDTNYAYIILQYNGTLNGSLANLRAISLNPAYTITFVDPSTTPNFLEVRVSGAPQPLVWQGNNPAAPGVWDQETANWLNTVSSQPDRFYTGDPVTFDDTSSANTVTLNESLYASATFNNSSRNYTLVGNGVLGGVLDHEGSGTVTLALSNAPTLSSIVNNSGALVYNLQGAGPYTIGTSLSDNGSGLGTFIQAGSNTLFLGADNSAYNGGIVATNGVIQISSAASLGGYGVVYATNNGTLDLNDVAIGSKALYLSGSGYNGLGALYDSSVNTSPHRIFAVATLLGDTTIGANGRLDTIQNSSAFQGNGYKVTKVGSGQFWFDVCGDPNVGDIDVQAGIMAVQGKATFGIPTKTMTLEPGTKLQLYSAVGPQAKVLVMNSATISSSGASNNWAGPITLNGTNTFNLGYALGLDAAITGSGSLLKNSTAALYLNVANSYSGPTLLQGGSIVLKAGSSLGTSSFIQIASGTTLNVSALSAFTLGNGQFLGGNGTIQGGNTVFGSGSTLKAGLGDLTTYTLTVKGNLTFQAGSTNRVSVKKTTTIANDKITGLTAVTLGGTLVVTNIGNALAGGDAIPLFSATSYSGSFSSIIPPQPGPGLAWDTSTLLSDGNLRVVATVNTTPTNLLAQVSGGQLTLSWPADHLGWRLLAQTNAPGVGLTTNWVPVPGSSTNTLMSFPISPANGSVFYRMVYP